MAMSCDKIWPDIFKVAKSPAEFMTGARSIEDFINVVKSTSRTVTPLFK